MIKNALIIALSQTWVVITLMECAITDETYLKTNFINYVSAVSSFVFVFSNNMLLVVIYKRGGVIKTRDSKKIKISSMFL